MHERKLTNKIAEVGVLVEFHHMVVDIDWDIFRKLTFPTTYKKCFKMSASDDLRW